MKTVIDAVNDLKGDLESSRYTSHIYHNSHPYLIYRACGWELNVLYPGAATVKDFERLVFELSHAPWIKGASLAEYQAADKEVLKVESKAAVKLTEKQISIIVEAMKCKIDSLSSKFNNMPYPANLAMVASFASQIGVTVSQAQQSGANFEQLLCLIYGIKE